MRITHWLAVFTLVAIAAIGYSSLTFAATTASFNANLTISSATPTIDWVQTGLTINPLEHSTRTLYVLFNVSDDNGFADINYSRARLVVNYTTESQRASTVGTCIAQANYSLHMQINCSVNMYYYDKDASWTINVSVYDGAGQLATNNTYTFDYGFLKAATTLTTGVTFGSVTLGQTAAASNNPLIVNNTGNRDFTQINLTAYDFVGLSNPAESIGASNFTVNATSQNLGQRLGNQSDVNITGASVARDVGGIDTNASLYFMVTLPSTGLSSQSYATSTSWQIAVFP